MIKNNNLQRGMRSLMHKAKGGGRRIEQRNRKRTPKHGHTSNSYCSSKRVSADVLAGTKPRSMGIEAAWRVTDLSLLPTLAALGLFIIATRLFLL